MDINDVIAVEGNTQLLDGGAMFGNAPKEMWKSWTTVDEKNRIPLASRSMYVNYQGKHLLFETGIGAFFEPKLKERYGVLEPNHVLLKNLEKIGLSHEDIDAVILSHLHFDHAGGTLTAYGEGQPGLLFPNAKYYVGKNHWERACRPHPRDKASFIPILNTLLQASGRLVLVEPGETTDLAPFVTFRFSDGHTPGLMLAEVHLDDGPLLFVSDLIPGQAWVHVPISMGYDRYPELVIQEKEQILKDLFQQKGRLFFTHDVGCAIADIKFDSEKNKFFSTCIR